jgi:homoserine kinase
VPSRSTSTKRAFSVVVPASSANVGCAFDCAAIALNLYLRASVTPIASGFEIAYRGPNDNEVPRTENNLILRAMQRAAAAKHAQLPSLRLDVQNDIPLGVGLGSSSAAIVAGILLGSVLCGGPLPLDQALGLAAEIEGHPDNVAAALHGGFVVAAAIGAAADVLVAKAAVSDNLHFVVVIPEIPLPTEKARAVLPGEYSRRDVVGNLQRTALLAASFFSGGDLSPELFADRLHQPYRSALIPGIAECLAFRHRHLAGVFLSGAGSAVMAIARRSVAEIGDALVGEFRRKGTDARVLLLKADNRGAQLVGSSSSRKAPASKTAGTRFSAQKEKQRRVAKK